MVSSGKKLKKANTCEKQLYKNIRFVLWKKLLEKNTKYSRNETILKIGHHASAIAHEKAIAFAKFVFRKKNGIFNYEISFVKFGSTLTLKETVPPSLFDIMLLSLRAA